MMIHQMMLLMHLEMQLRQQALVSYQEAQDPGQRMQRLDDVMALNEQLNEVGSILGVLLNVPLDRGAAVRLAATTNTESPQADHHRPSTLGGRFGASVTGGSSIGSLLPRFRFRVPDTDTDDDDDDDDDNGADGADDDADEVTDDTLSFVANTDDSDVLDEDFGLTSSSRLPARITVSHTVGAERVSAGVSVSTSGNSGMSYPSGTGHRQLASTVPVASTSTSTSIASNGYSSVVLSRRRNRPATPRWTAVEQSPTSVTVNDLQSSARVRSQAGVGTSPSQTLTLPQIQSTGGGVIAASRTPVTQNVDHVWPAVAGRQLTTSASSTGTPRQLDHLSENRSSGASSAVNWSTAVTTNSQTLPATSHVVSSTTGGASSSGAINASQQLNSASSYQQLAGRSDVLTEPWPVLSTAEPRTSTLVSRNRSTVAQPAARLSHTRGTMARSHANTDSHLPTVRLPAGAMVEAHGPRRAAQEMHNNRPVLQLRRSSVRNSLGRPAGPASVSTLRPSVPQRMVPLPHPPARGGQQQGFGDRGTAGGRNYASNDVLRPRRRSEIAHEIMFPSQKDTDQ